MRDAKQHRSLVSSAAATATHSMQQPHTSHTQLHQQQQHHHHHPPPLNTITPQQYAAYSSHTLRTPSHLTTSTSTPAMAVVSHSVDTSSPSPHSHSQQQVQQRMRDSQQQRARSYSSTQPTPALTHSTPSPLSSSNSSFTSSSSSSSSSSTERWVRECLLKCCQLVLHNRLLLAESDYALPVNKSFNLHTPEAGVTHADWDERMRGREGDVIVLDIVLKGGGRAGPVLLERWSLHHDMDDMMFNASSLSSSSSTGPASSRRVDPTIMFKRMLLLCRSLYSYVRLLPAAALAKQVHTYVEYGKSPPFTLDFSLHTASTSSPASFIATPTSFNFTAVATPRGTFSVSVSYVADLASVAVGTPQRVQPVMERGEVMEDYVGHKASEAQRQQAPATRRQSMPVAVAYPPRAASALPAPTSSTPHSLPHTLPHQLTHRKSSRSNSSTYIDSYSPGTNTPTFTHGTPPTPSQYPLSLTDTPPFSSVPSSPHPYSLHMPHSHSSPMAIAPPPAASPTSTSTSSHSPSHAAASPPIAIPIPVTSSTPTSFTSRLSSQRQSLPQTPPLHALPATDRLSSRSLTSQAPLSQMSSRSRSTGGYSPVERALSTPSSRHAAMAVPPTTSLSLLASSRSQQRLSSIAPPALAAHSDRNAQLGTLIQWFSSLPPLESSTTTSTTADGGTARVVRMRSVDDALQQLNVLLERSQQLKERSAAAR